MYEVLHVEHKGMGLADDVNTGQVYEGVNHQVGLGWWSLTQCGEEEYMEKLTR